mmetsp:Transcript_13693/g.29254  ORF Transcript_13693/g.29254 Transcript_13693/m.29254 type:complete len:358 (+) Transcript_13693:202-1275(+)
MLIHLHMSVLQQGLADLHAHLAHAHRINLVPVIFLRLHQELLERVVALAADLRLGDGETRLRQLAGHVRQQPRAVVAAQLQVEPARPRLDGSQEVVLELLAILRANDGAARLRLHVELHRGGHVQHVDRRVVHVVIRHKEHAHRIKQQRASVGAADAHEGVSSMDGVVDLHGVEVALLGGGGEEGEARGGLGARVGAAGGLLDGGGGGEAADAVHRHRRRQPLARHDGRGEHAVQPLVQVHVRRIEDEASVDVVGAGAAEVLLDELADGAQVVLVERLLVLHRVVDARLKGAAVQALHEQHQRRPRVLRPRRRRDHRQVVARQQRRHVAQQTRSVQNAKLHDGVVCALALGNDGKGL